ncbi:MAG: energy transducer TonB [Opitutaceae bacterium]|nr:energy transducer TonB [Opitutaceae bacterium]
MSLGASRLTNVSVRSTAGTGADTLIVGFSLTGSGTKQMLVRGIGPALTPFGVPGVVTDPRLQLFNSAAATLATNDDWGGSATVAAAFAAVGAFALPPASRDAALLTPLPTGTYSMHLVSAGGPGIALVEAYDTDTGTPTAWISNISARSLAGTGAAVLTVGFAITGEERKTVLIRAVGPTLAGFGVGGALTNPVLRLVSSRGNEIGLNDDWSAAAGWGPVFSMVGAFSLATNSRDSALLVSLAPGAYTAQASDAGGGSGVALIEVYDVPSPPITSYVLQPVEFSSAPFPRTPTALASVNPVVLTQARPIYPFDLRRAGLTGEVSVDFIVEPTGLVSGAYPVRAHDTQFSASAIAAVSQWIFRPGRNAAGQNVAVRMQVPIIYTLDVE